jgi:hypothetical protein
VIPGRRRSGRYRHRVVTLALAVAVGAVAGVLRRPGGCHLVRPRVEQVGLLGLGAALNALSVLLSGPPAVAALLASLAVLIAVAVANRHLTGVAVVGVGLLVNLVAVAVNGGMPVRAGALEAAGIEGTVLSDPRHLETAGDPLPVLGDVLPVPVAREVVSFGDLIVVLGAADAVRELSRRRGRARATVQRPARTTKARLDQVWGTAPSGAPVSATQCSAYPDLTAPVQIDLSSAEPASEPISEPELVAASHST